MSMLLDALKKSEEQRRIGAKPDISRETPDHQRDAADPLRQWLPLALIVVSVLVMAWFGWRQFRPPVVVSGEPQVAERTLAAPPAASREAARPGNAPVNAPGARTPVAQFEAPQEAESAKSASAEEAAPDPSEREQVRRSFSQYEAPPDAAAAADSAEEQAEEPNEPAAAQAATRRTVSTGRGEPYEPEAMSYWELPQGVRDSLPEFKVTVLVFAEDPADRFLLVNGVRLKEKDELQSGVVLDEIRRDGAVFRARNYRFLVKG